MINRTPTIDEIYWEALQITSPARRAEWLDQRCGNDRQLRALVAKLLRAQPKAEQFLENPIGLCWPSADQAPLEGPGMQIDSYELLEQIGEGGFGMVFMAEQH